MQIHSNRAVTPRRVKRAQTPHKLLNPRGFEKIYYKCIPLYSFFFALNLVLRQLKVLDFRRFKYL